MSLVLSEPSGSAAYLALLAHLLDDGERVMPRGMPVLEARNTSITITDPHQVHVLSTTRRPPVKIVATESLHLIAGVSSLEQLDLASGGRFLQFSDRGRLRGAYGPRTYNQLKFVVQLLAEDPDTRQAVATIWNGTELREPSHDVPCTLSFQFFIRKRKLEMRVEMRSNDAWLGFPIDIEVFSSLHRSIAAALGLEPGPYYHVTGSMHLYERDVERAMSVVNLGPSPAQREPAPGLSAEMSDISPAQRWHATARAARMQAVMGVMPVFDGAAWYDEHVPRLTPGAWLCRSCRYVTPHPCSECAPTGTENVPMLGGLL